MRLGRRAGSFTSFVDAFTEETILRVEADAYGEILVTFHLYDCNGVLVQDSGGCRSFPAGTEIRADDDEMLLCVPADREGLLSYCLYDRKGSLLTRSNGLQTQLFRGLRVVGNKPLSGRPPAAPANPQTPA